MNQTLETIAGRYSCRSFDARLPEQAALDAIALAAVQAPSAMNHQPWQVVVITDKAFIEEMDAEGMRLLAQEDPAAHRRFVERGGRLYYGAPCMFLVLQQPGRDLDTGILCENISLAAASLGLGSLICGMAAVPFGGEKGAAFRQKAGIGGPWEFGIAVLVGHAAAPGAPHEADTSKIRYVR